jgi:hypothetical protein
MDQEPTNAMYAPSRTTSSNGNKLVKTAQLSHALELVIVLLFMMAKCTSSVVKTTRTISFATFGALTLPQRLSPN